MGTVDIGHVLSGIDAQLSGFPAAYPTEMLKAHGHDTAESKFKYEQLKSWSGGDATTFTTFAGDLGQAYAIYIHDRYDKGDQTAKLSSYIAQFAKPAELRGDLHGYIAVQVDKI